MKLDPMTEPYIIYYTPGRLKEKERGEFKKYFLFSSIQIGFRLFLINFIFQNTLFFQLLNKFLKLFLRH